MFPFPCRSRIVDMIGFAGEGGGNGQLNILLDVVVCDSIGGTPQPPTNCLRTISSSPSYLSLLVKCFLNPSAALFQLLQKWSKLTDGVNKSFNHERNQENKSKLKETGSKLRRRVIRNVGNLDGCTNALNEKVDALMSCMASMDNLQQPVESISFHETICFTNVDKLHAEGADDHFAPLTTYSLSIQQLENPKPPTTIALSLSHGLFCNNSIMPALYAFSR
ncbi:hypothetical protein LXL04_033389 [Taraxacum kok-saghyz]